METMIVTVWLLVSHNFGPSGPMYADLASCESVRARRNYSRNFSCVSANVVVSSKPPKS